MRTEIGTPLKAPPGFDLDTTRICSFIVNVACNMCEQWKIAGQPSADKFSWKPADKCPITSPVFPLRQWKFQGPLWSSFTPALKKISEPFAIFASDPDTRTTFLAFRGSQTEDDFIMDGKTGLVPYSPPSTISPSANIQVAHGFYGVFNGFDQDDLKSRLKEIADSGRTLVVTGHSLGSTLATLTIPLALAAGIPSTNILHYNQASPKVGDSNFQTYYKDSGVQTFRVVNTYDGVPNLPKAPAYVAVGAEVSFGADYQDEQKCHSPCCSYSYAVFNPTAPFNTDMNECMKRVKP